MAIHPTRRVLEVSTHALPPAQDFTKALPTEVALRILSFMRSSDVSSVLGVNKRWRDLATCDLVSRDIHDLDLCVLQIRPLLTRIEQHIPTDDSSKFQKIFETLQKNQMELKTNKQQDLEFIFNTKEVLALFRRELIKSLSVSTTAFNEEEQDSLLTRPIPLKGEFEHLIKLAQATAEIAFIVEDEFIPSVRHRAFNETFQAIFPNLLENPLPELCIRDIVSVVEPEASKLLMTKLLLINEPLVAKLIQLLSDRDKDTLFQEWAAVKIANGDFIGAKEKIASIKDTSLKSRVLIMMIETLIKNDKTDEALEVFKEVDYFPIPSRKNLVAQIARSIRFSEPDLRSSQVVNKCFIYFTSKLQQQDFPIFYETFFRDPFSLVKDQLDQLKASLADKLVEQGEFELAILIAMDKVFYNQELIAHVRSKVFYGYLNTLPQDSAEKALAIEEFLKQFSYLQQTGFRAYLTIAMLRCELYEDALIQLEKFPKNRNFCGYEYRQVHLEEVINNHIQKSDYQKVLTLSNYIDSPSWMLFSCVLHRAEKVEEGSFKQRLIQARQECFPDLSSDKLARLEGYIQSHLERAPR